MVIFPKSGLINTRVISTLKGSIAGPKGCHDIHADVRLHKARLDMEVFFKHLNQLFRVKTSLELAPM